MRLWIMQDGVNRSTPFIKLLVNNILMIKTTGELSLKSHSLSQARLSRHNYNTLYNTNIHIPVGILAI